MAEGNRMIWCREKWTSEGEVWYCEQRRNTASSILQTTLQMKRVMWKIVLCTSFLVLLLLLVSVHSFSHQHEHHRHPQHYLGTGVLCLAVYMYLCVYMSKFLWLCMCGSAKLPSRNKCPRLWWKSSWISYLPLFPHKVVALFRVFLFG